MQSSIYWFISQLMISLYLYSWIMFHFSSIFLSYLLVHVWFKWFPIIFTKVRRKMVGILDQYNLFNCSTFNLISLNYTQKSKISWNAFILLLTQVKIEGNCWQKWYLPKYKLFCKGNSFLNKEVKFKYFLKIRVKMGCNPLVLCPSLQHCWRLDANGLCEWHLTI